MVEGGGEVARWQGGEGEGGRRSERGMPRCRFDAVRAHWSNKLHAPPKVEGDPSPRATRPCTCLRLTCLKLRAKELKRQFGPPAPREEQNITVRAFGGVHFGVCSYACCCGGNAVGSVRVAVGGADAPHAYSETEF